MQVSCECMSVNGELGNGEQWACELNFCELHKSFKIYICHVSRILFPHIQEYSIYVDKIFYLRGKNILLMIQNIHPSKHNILFVTTISYIIFVAGACNWNLEVISHNFQYDVLNY